MISWVKGLNRQILLITMSIAIGASIIMGMVALLVFYEYSKTQALSNSFDAAVDITSQINTLMTDSMDDITAVAKDENVRLMEGQKVQAQINQLFALSKTFDGISAVDEKAKVIAFTPYKPNIIGSDLSYRRYFQEVMSNRKIYVSEPFKGVSGNNVIVIACPVLGSDGRVHGVLAGSFNLVNGKKLASIIGTEFNQHGLTIQVISRSGTILFDPRQQRVMQKASSNEAVHDVLNGKEGSTSLNIDGRVYLVGYKSIPRLGWGVIVEYPQDKALASAFYLRNLMTVVAAIICILVFFVAYFESKAITRPLELLLKGVQRVAAGDYHFNVNVRAQNEIGILASAFNTMVERIKTMREDILQKKEKLEKANIELEVMAITDGLTKLYNHRYFQDCLDQAVSIAQQECNSLSLMILDLDHFKYYNDLFGHHAGDMLLAELADLLIRELGPNDMLARYGGDEFTVILYGSDNNHALKVAESLRTAVEAFPFRGREQQPEGKITVSIGVASYPENAKTKEELLRLADEALYKAKSCSRNKVELYFSVLDELQQDLDQSEADLVNTTKMLIRIINAKDKYTYGHSERVGRYAVWIAKKLGLPDDEIQTIKIGAFLHDIGKIEISEEILVKRDQLTNEEYALVKKHPFWGAGIIKAVKSLNHTLPLVSYHHEWFDGNGYPKGLKGLEIPLHARILAVADSFDAMTSNRPYRKRKFAGEAIAELKKCAGTQFDPEIVKAFINVWQEQNEEVG